MSKQNAAGAGPACSLCRAGPAFRLDVIRVRDRLYCPMCGRRCGLVGVGPFKTRRRPPVKRDA